MRPVDRRAEELSMMATPGRWPLWPVLPVKREARYSPDEGVMVEAIGLYGPGTYAVLSTNLFALGPTSTWGEIPHEMYATLEAVLDAGWVVD